MLNDITIMGRLCKDVTLRYTGTGKPVASFSIACDRDFGDKQTDFFDVTAWGKTGEFIDKYFKKGDMIALRGNLQQRSWEDKNGQTRHTVEINAQQAFFCGGKKSNDDGFEPDHHMPDSGFSGFEDLDDDEQDLPF